MNKDLEKQNKELSDEYKKVHKHYYSVKDIYKDKVKEVVQSHSEAFNLDTKEKLITDLQRLLLKRNPLLLVFLVFLVCLRWRLFRVWSNQTNKICGLKPVRSGLFLKIINPY